MWIRSPTSSDVFRRLAAVLLVLTVWPSLDLAFSMTPGGRSARQQGVSWVGGPDRVTGDDFKRLVDDHVNWIVQTPFGWQRGLHSSKIGMSTAGGHQWWGESDEGLIETGRLAREAGIRVLLKPHLWLIDSPAGKWRTDIEMRSDEDWRAWFDSYRRFILHYARLAEEQGFAGLCVGTELQLTAIGHEAEWRRIIREVREVYHGKLTYAANWYEEFEEIPFWDALDWIGIQAYFPLTEKRSPGVEELEKGWAPHLDAIRKVQARYKLPVLFTEVGYKSTEDAAVKPWKWRDPSAGPCTDAGLRTQANGYEAFFRTFWDEPWFAGAYWWKWFPRLGRNTTARADRSFSPQNKPAEEVMARWYSRAAGAKKPDSATTSP